MIADFLKKLSRPDPQPLDDADARLALTALLVRLGPVEIHRVRIIVAPMWIMASKLVSVLQARIAIRLNSLSF